jgi:hypothetical protein
MQSDAEILEAVREAFCNCRKPEHFTNYAHCEECQEHDDTLRAKDVETLAREDVGNVGWDPLCFTSPEGITYLFPALARLALADETESFDWYGSQLLFHLTNDQEQNRLIRYFSRDQRNAVAVLLRHIKATRYDQVANYVCEDELDIAITLWS